MMQGRGKLKSYGEAMVSAFFNACVSMLYLGESGGMPPRKIFVFPLSEIDSGAFSQKFLIVVSSKFLLWLDLSPRSLRSAGPGKPQLLLVAIAMSCFTLCMCFANQNAYCKSSALVQNAW